MAIIASGTLAEDASSGQTNVFFAAASPALLGLTINIGADSLKLVGYSIFGPRMNVASNFLHNHVAGDAFTVTAPDAATIEASDKAVWQISASDEV